MDASNYLGWIKVWRKLASDSMWLEERFTRGQAWVDLLLLAQGLDRTEYYDGQYLNFKSGTVYKSVSWLGERWKWNRRTVSLFLTQLEKANMIKVTSQKRHGTSIQIVNWHDYQSGQKTSHFGETWEKAKNPEKVHKSQSHTAKGLEADFQTPTAQMTAQMTAHNKEDKEEKEIIYYVQSENPSATPSAPLLKGGSGEASDSGKERIPPEWRDDFESYEAYWRWRNQ